ncbi:class I SAM-dependent methyltransferase [Phycicoccus sp. HDW14]|uniref:class I SAM-dependent methyltransferase n=1 Tax=Phycicoccus sp. HDW14 TaxID=2714941 RepID=UPI00140DC588|nr:class I SAM-dependent methyltransferase [Phycicoccus sp. HDW14]QIM20975.1 class I SAM-dependent methyltransferase [Phycicoccus sp. HDW14]
MRAEPPRRYRTLGRSVRLFRSFLVEQTEPDRFYGELADDTVRLVEDHEPLGGATVADVGSGQPAFPRAFTAAGARYVGLDLDRAALHPLPGRAGAVQARGERLPLADGSVDVAVSSNLMEHVTTPGEVGAEMLRVVRPGGLVVISYTSWASPWGGHETSPWHWLGGDYAARRYEAHHGHPPKNRYGVTMHPTRVGDGLRWARGRSDARVLEASPRYHPDWARGVVHLPLVREVLTWNLLLVLRRR